MKCEKELTELSEEVKFDSSQLNKLEKDKLQKRKTLYDQTRRKKTKN